jgi:CRP-like cAMP-binding protein
MWCDAGFRSLLTDDLWHAVGSLGVSRIFDTGEHLMIEGESGTRVVVLLDGRVKVTCCEVDGSEVLLAIRGGGDVVGERAAIDHGLRSATVTALRRCSTRLVTAGEFMRFVHAHDLANAMLRLSISRQREGQMIRVELSTLPVARRLERTLLRLAEAMGSGGEDSVTVDLGMPQEELARAIGASRSQVAAHLARLRDAHMVLTSRRRIAVLDLSGLRNLDAGRSRL